MHYFSAHTCYCALYVRRAGAELANEQNARCNRTCHVRGMNIRGRDREVPRCYALDGYCPLDC